MTDSTDIHGHCSYHTFLWSYVNIGIVYVCGYKIRGPTYMLHIIHITHTWIVLEDDE